MFIYLLKQKKTQKNFFSYYKNIATFNQENIDKNEDESCQTLIYSDCFSPYLTSEFREFYYILKRLNHSKSLRGQVKRYSNNLSGLFIEVLQKKFDNNENLIKDYLSRWLWYSLFIRETIRNK